MIVDGFEQDLDLCVWGPWEEINGETHEWIRHCGSCSNYQSTTRDPSLPPEVSVSNEDNNVHEMKDPAPTPAPEEPVLGTTKPDETNTGENAASPEQQV